MDSKFLGRPAVVEPTVAADSIERWDPGARVSKDAISAITDKVIEEMTDWCNRLLRQGGVSGGLPRRYQRQGRRWPGRLPAIYVAIGVTCAGEGDILAFWAGYGGNGDKFWMAVLTEIKSRGTNDVCIAVCAGLKGLPDAVTAVWGRAVVQR